MMHLLGVIAIGVSATKLVLKPRSRGRIARRIGQARYLFLHSVITALLAASIVIHGRVAMVALAIALVAMIVLNLDDYLNGDDDNDGGFRRRVKQIASKWAPALVPAAVES